MKFTPCSCSNRGKCQICERFIKKAQTQARDQERRIKAQAK